MSAALLPGSSTALEREVAAVTAEAPAIAAAVGNLARLKRSIRLPDVLPFLHFEYGLRKLAPYLSSPYQLITEGRAWTEERGTAPAVDRGLAWLQLSADIEENLPERRFWNGFQLLLEQLPGNDAPLLERIEGVTTLSAPERSKFRRAVHGYDVRAAEADHSRLDGAMLDWSSGVKATAGTRNFPEAATWSFGREHEIEHLLTEDEGTSIGNWIEPVDPEDVLAWEDMTYPWETATFAWDAGADAQRRALLAAWFLSAPIYLTLSAAGQPIGHRRCRAVHTVAASSAGAYFFDGTVWEPSPGAGRLYVEALTDFEDADGVTADACALIIGADLATGVPAGRRWLQPAQLVGGSPIAVTSLSVPLRRTVRERFKFMLRF